MIFRDFFLTYHFKLMHLVTSLILYRNSKLREIVLILNWTFVSLILLLKTLLSSNLKQLVHAVIKQIFTLMSFVLSSNILVVHLWKILLGYIIIFNVFCFFKTIGYSLSTMDFLASNILKRIFVCLKYEGHLILINILIIKLTFFITYYFKSMLILF